MSKMVKMAMAIVVCGLAIACLISGGSRWLTAAETGTSGGSADSPTGAAADNQDRLREGTSLSDRAGYFKLTGDRLTFYSPDGTLRLGGLENLNLERIAKIVGESPEALEWVVSGTITEYQGTNYLLISRAVLKTKLKRRGPVSKA